MGTLFIVVVLAIVFGLTSFSKLRMNALSLVGRHLMMVPAKARDFLMAMVGISEPAWTRNERQGSPSIVVHNNTLLVKSAVYTHKQRVGAAPVQVSSYICFISSPFTRTPLDIDSMQCLGLVDSQLNSVGALLRLLFAEEGRCVSLPIIRNIIP